MKRLSALGVALWLLAVPAFAEFKSITATVQSAQTGNAAGNAITVDNYSSVSVQVDITGTATVNFEGTQDQSTWSPVACIQVGDTTYTSITTTTTTMTVRCNVAGLVQFRARTSGNTGTVTVTATSSPAVMGSGGGGSGGGAGTLDQAFDAGKIIDGANSQANAVRIGDGVTPMCAYTDGTLGPLIKPCTDANTRTYAWTNFTWCLFDVEGNSCAVTFDPDASSVNAMYQFTTNYKPVASLLLPLEPRGAASSGKESIVTNQPTDWYLTVTDANTDAADFSFPVTAKMAGATTMTFRLIGVSKNAAPSGNIDLDCAVTTYTPGTDTFTAHSTTGEVTALLTPATQNRPVAVTTSAHTINGGALVEGDIVYGSCEVDATATTSIQLTDFRLWANVRVQLLVNSLSD